MRSRLVEAMLEAELDESGLGAVYRRQLLNVLDEGVEPDVSSPSLNKLPTLTCQASGGIRNQATAVQAAWQVVRLAVKLLDDVEDGAVNEQPGVAVNTATGLLMAAPLMLDRGLGMGSRDLRERTCAALHRAVLRACAGQHADLTAVETQATDVDPQAWLTIAGAKSGEFLAWAAWAGALVGGADEPALASYREYGYHLGVLLQVADDLNDIWYPAGASDLTVGCLSLPVCYALSVAEAEDQESLKTLLKQAARGNEGAEAQLRQWLIDLGAQAYLLVVGQLQRQAAAAALQRAHPTPPTDEQLIELLDRIMPALAGVGF
jgi:geranylgeranyl pyrophosphate synthase